MLVAVVTVGSPIAIFFIAAARDRADQNAQEALEQAQEAEAARDFAVLALESEQRERAQNHRLLVSSFVANGTRALDGGDLFGALVWYGEALHSDAGNAEREEPHRVRIAGVLRRCPRLVQVWFTGDPVPPAFSPTGRQVLLVRKDTAQVWDVASGKAGAEPMRHSKKIERATFSPDGSRVLTASADGTARIWDASTGKAITDPLEHGSPVTFAAFSPDGSRVVTLGNDRTARVWDARGGKRIAGPLLHKKPVLFASFSGDGRHLVTCGGAGMDSHRGEFAVWDLPGVDKVAPLRPAQTPRHVGSTEVVNRWAVLLNEKHLVTAGGKRRLRHWDLSSNPPRLDGESFSGVRLEWDGTLSADRTWVLRLNGSQALVCDLASGKPTGPPLLHGGEVLLAAFSPDGKRIVTASRDRTVRVWDAGTSQPLSPPLRHGQLVHRAAFSADGQRLLTCEENGFGDQVVRVWEMASHELAQPRVLLGSGPSAISPDGHLVARTDSSGAVQLHEAVSDKPVFGPWKIGSPIKHLLFSPAGRCLLLASEESARVWDVVRGEPATPVFSHSGLVKEVLFTPDGSRVAILNTKDQLQVFDALTGQRQSSSPLVRGAIWKGVSLSPDGTAAVVVRNVQLIEMHDCVSGALRGGPFRSAATITHTALSPAGDRLAVCHRGWLGTDRERRHGQAPGAAAGPRSTVASGRFQRRRPTAGDRGRGPDPPRLGRGHRPAGHAAAAPRRASRPRQSQRRRPAPGGTRHHRRQLRLGPQPGHATRGRPARSDAVCSPDRNWTAAAAALNRWNRPACGHPGRDCERSIPRNSACRHLETS